MRFLVGNQDVINCDYKLDLISYQLLLCYPPSAGQPP